jgi:hypothetical protein
MLLLDVELSPFALVHVPECDAIVTRTEKEVIAIFGEGTQHDLPCSRYYRYRLQLRQEGVNTIALGDRRTNLQ